MSELASRPKIHPSSRRPRSLNITRKENSQEWTPPAEFGECAQICGRCAGKEQWGEWGQATDTGQIAVLRTMEGSKLSTLSAATRGYVARKSSGADFRQRLRRRTICAA